MVGIGGMDRKAHGSQYKSIVSCRNILDLFIRPVFVPIVSQKGQLGVFKRCQTEGCRPADTKGERGAGGILYTYIYIYIYYIHIRIYIYIIHIHIYA